MGDLIQFPVVPVQMRAVVCGCGNETFLLLETGEVFCSNCEYIISNLRWEQDDADQGSGETPVP